MANIDLQSLISQLSATNSSATGATAGTQSGVEGQLFGSILGQQQQSVAPQLLAGKDLPGGKLAANLAETGISQPGQAGIGTLKIAPANVELAHMLAKLAQMPAESASLPMQELQAQLQQLMQGETVSETTLDDLTAMTSLMAGNDAVVHQLPNNGIANLSAKVAATGVVTDDTALLDEPQLLQAAQQMGIDPAVASYILHATKAVQTPVAQSAVATPDRTLDTAQLLGAKHLPKEPMHSGAASLLNTNVLAQSTGQPQVQPPKPLQVQVATQPPVTPQAQPQVQTTAQVQMQPQVQAQVPQPISDAAVRVNANPTANNPVANALVTQQIAAREITDDVVIRVRQGDAAPVANAAANNAATVGAQNFLRQRAMQVTSNAAVNSDQMPATSAGESLLRIPDALLQKLDLVSQPVAAQVASAPDALASPVTGASFKSMAQFNSLATSQAATTPGVTAEVPVAEGGSRLQSALQADNPAQQAARNMQNQVGQQLQRMVRDGQWQANINLNPARLGQIKINMTMEDGVLTTQLLSANQGVRELLETGMPRLRELLEESGLQLGQVDVGSDGKQQQFAEQDAQTGEVNQLSASETTINSSVNASTSNHDGDLDTFA